VPFCVPRDPSLENKLWLPSSPTSLRAAGGRQEITTDTMIGTTGQSLYFLSSAIFLYYETTKTAPGFYIPIIGSSTGKSFL
jgi:hypothetical protein